MVTEFPNRNPAPTVNSAHSRLRACVRGAVQGVGFRPFVFRLAHELGLAGWVKNSPAGVVLEVEGVRPVLDRFLVRLEADKPPRSFIQSCEVIWLDAAGLQGLEIRESESGGGRTTLILPDIATCPDCLRDIFDPQNRRHHYPFTNCTNCGPRFSIIEAVPYDRANTSMRRFAMCPRCQAEYDDPNDRRFHAQPNACPVCGPRLELWDPRGTVLNSMQAALEQAAVALCAGRIVAVKGLGGFHLMVSADNERAILRLRDLKHREEKPLAVMFPSLETVRAACAVSQAEERLLRSPEAPIVLLHRFQESQISSLIAPAVAPANPYLGAMLPYTPLHHLLLARVGRPVVATSGNLSDEPICIDETEALERLGGIADGFLVHDRPIVRHVDDSIVRVMLDREMVLRRARGYAPLPIRLASNVPVPIQNPGTAGLTGLQQQNNQSLSAPAATILAVGAHLKNSVALAIGPQVFLSQHIGDLETESAYSAFQRVTADLQQLLEAKPGIIAADAHPDYLSTRFALELVLTPALSRSAGEGKGDQASGRDLKRPVDPVPGLQAEQGMAGRSGPPRLVRVQHHIAHVLGCMAENELAPPVLGVAWDGTGFGLDGTIWGGEFFHVTDTTCERVAHLRPFRLPGGDRAVREPRRCALGLLFELFGEAAFEMKQLPPFQGIQSGDLASLKTMLVRGLNSPLTSSVGRLFDAVAALVGLRGQTRFEGQAAMALEFALAGVETSEAYEFTFPLQPTTANRPSPILDWAAMIHQILADVRDGTETGVISARFHNALADAVVTVARRTGIAKVALSGGCFQNRPLTERTVGRLRQAGFRPYWHQRVPPNDGGIALGQIMAARRELESRFLCV